MDLEGITWVGHIYQKFEAMCLEVEDIMYQDTVKYVENQVQTVGASVKKFYSDVMQDLIPPSSMDPVKVTASDLPVELYTDVGIYRKPKVGVKEEAVKVDSDPLTDNSKVIADLDTGANHAPSFHGLCNLDNLHRSSSWNSVKGTRSGLHSRQYNDGSMYNKSDLGVKVISKKKNQPPVEMSGEITHLERDMSRASFSNDNYERLCDQTAMTSTPVSVDVTAGHASIEIICTNIENSSEHSPNVSTEGPLSDMMILLESIGNKNKEMETRVSSYGDLPAESNVADIFTNNGVVSLVGSTMNGDIKHNELADKAVFVSHPGGSDDWSMDTIECSTVVEQGMKTIQQYGEVKDEETCVVVNVDELHFVPHREGKHRLYKKKIRDAIASRMRSSRKQEYEQLARWYGSETKSKKECLESSTPTLALAESKRSPTHDGRESDWELL